MVSISLCMIVKNEEDVLARALDSVKELADEMIIASGIVPDIRLFHIIGNAGSETGRGSYGKAGCTRQSCRQARCCILTLRSNIIRTVQMALIETSGYTSP